MTIRVISLENTYTNNTPTSKVTFELIELVGILTRVVDKFTIAVASSYSIADDGLINEIKLAMAGTQWEQYTT